MLSTSNVIHQKKSLVPQCYLPNYKSNWFRFFTIMKFNELPRGVFRIITLAPQVLMQSVDNQKVQNVKEKVPADHKHYLHVLYTRQAISPCHVTYRTSNMVSFTVVLPKSMFFKLNFYGLIIAPLIRWPIWVSRKMFK